MTTACRACGNDRDNKEHIATEMFYGIGGTFPYVECSRCGSLSLSEIPTDLGKYYPAYYYALAGESSLKRAMKAVRARHAIVKPTLLGHLLTHMFGPANLWWLSRLKLPANAPILDVGCGTGEVLREMLAVGYSDVTGVDPYAREDRRPQILCMPIENAPLRRYQLVMMHHALEHCVDPVAVMRELRKRVATDGHVLIRIPLSGQMAWRLYATSWVQLDAPRHVCLFSKRAFIDVAATTGFDVVDTVFDSAPSQFLASEQYKNGVPHVRHVRPSPAEAARSARLTKQVNAAGDGDQACFFLRPT